MDGSSEKIRLSLPIGQEEVAEKRLQELCASNGRAVRDRLSQLNAEMSRKLFLG